MQKLCKSVNWFLYDRDLRDERVNLDDTLLKKQTRYPNKAHDVLFKKATPSDFDDVNETSVHRKCIELFK